MKHLNEACAALRAYARSKQAGGIQVMIREDGRVELALFSREGWTLGLARADLEPGGAHMPPAQAVELLRPTWFPGGKPV